MLPGSVVASHGAIVRAQSDARPSQGRVQPLQLHTAALKPANGCLPERLLFYMVGVLGWKQALDRPRIGLPPRSGPFFFSLPPQESASPSSPASRRIVRKFSENTKFSSGKSKSELLPSI